MMRVPEILLEHVAFSTGEEEVDNRLVLPEKVLAATGFYKRYVVRKGTSLVDLASRAVASIPRSELDDIGGIIFATFSSENRFPSPCVELASRFSLPSDIPMFDVQMACSAYPYAVYLASKLSVDTGKKTLLIDGDIQSALCDGSDTVTTPLFSDAVSATLVSAGDGPKSEVAFFNRASNALSCSPLGPITMDGFGVFSFVASEVTPMLKSFVSSLENGQIDAFVPHQANMYMVRQLANSLKLSEKLVTSGEDFANPGSTSIPLTIAYRNVKGRVLIAGFGAGLSASAAVVTVR